LYHIATRFDILAHRRRDFVAATLEYGSDSLTSDPGLERYELIADEANPNHLYLYEVYRSFESFGIHRDAPQRLRFFEIIDDYVTGCASLITGNLIEDTIKAHTPENAPDLFMKRYLAWSDSEPQA